jgi:hypothetical protein
MSRSLNGLMEELAAIVEEGVGQQEPKEPGQGPKGLLEG